MSIKINEVTNLNDDSFKSEINNPDYLKFTREIFWFFQNETVSHKTFEKVTNTTITNRLQFNRFFGLPYTSSGAFACLTVTNAQYEFVPGYYARFFALTHDNQIILICLDNEGNEKYFLIGKV